MVPNRNFANHSSRAVLIELRSVNGVESSIDRNRSTAANGEEWSANGKRVRQSDGTSASIVDQSVGVGRRSGAAPASSRRRVSRRRRPDANQKRRPEKNSQAALALFFIIYRPTLTFFFTYRVFYIFFVFFFTQILLRSRRFFCHSYYSLLPLFRDYFRPFSSLRAFVLFSLAFP